MEKENYSVSIIFSKIKESLFSLGILFKFLKFKAVATMVIQGDNKTDKQALGIA